MPALVVIVIVLVMFFYFCGFVYYKLSDFVYENQSFFIFIKEHYLIFCAVPFFIVGVFFIRLFQTIPKKKITITKDKSMPIEKSDKKVIAEKDLKPIDDLDIEKFAKQAASYFDNPDRYSDFLTGWWHRMNIKRSSKAVSQLNEYMVKLQQTSCSARELQEEILKNRVIFKFQAEIALQRLKEEWDRERSARELEMLSLEAEKAKQRFLTSFYNEVKHDELSESAKILLSMTNPKVESSSTFSEVPGLNISGSSSNKVYSDPVDIMSLSKQEKILEVLIKDKLADLDKKGADVDGRNKLS